MRSADEAARILRKIRCIFPDGKQQFGSGFVGDKPNEIITCAHVISHDGQLPEKVFVNDDEGEIKEKLDDIDIAILASNESEVSRIEYSYGPSLGEEILFSGFPAGVKYPSVFSGIVSCIGTSLLSFPTCELIQINGMINAGNSGGPLLNNNAEVIGVITAKFVPLLVEVDRLLKILKQIPQFPSEIGIGKIDFSKFVNLMIQALSTISGSLRLVQVGTGYAVPTKLLKGRK